MGGSPTKVQYNAIMKPTNIVQRPLSVVVPVVTVEGGGAQAVIANARTVLANQQQQKQQHQVHIYTFFSSKCNNNLFFDFSAPNQ